MSVLEDKIVNLINPVAVSNNLVVGLINVFGSKTITVQIFLENLEGKSPSLDACASFSRQIAPILDSSNIIDKKYFLEVSSFGIDRPLLNQVDFERFKNNDCIIKTKFLLDGKKKFAGLLLGLKNNAVLLKVGNEEIEIPLDSIDKANLDIVKNIKINKNKE